MTIPILSTDPCYYKTYDRLGDPKIAAAVASSLAGAGYELVPEGTAVADFEDDYERSSGGTRWETWAAIGKSLNTFKLEGSHWIWRRPLRLAQKQGLAPVTAGSLEEQERKRLEAEMMFWFGMKPTDPSKLPPAPQPSGAWPDLDDSY